MKKNSILIALALFSAGGTWAEELPKDTLKVIDVEEIVVIAAPKENRKLREQPTAVTMLSQQDMQANQVNSIKSLTALVPNIFIPDYGSKLTSAIYILWDRFTHQYTVSGFVRRQCPLHRQISFRLQLCRH